jgi:acetoacetyl-CoA synthetase
MAKFRDYANKRYRKSLKSYPELHAWSTDPITAGDFWLALFDFLDMGATAPPTSACEPVRISSIYVSRVAQGFAYHSI